MFRIVCLTFLLIFWLPVSGQAATASGLYEGEVPVADQSEATRRQAVRGALAQVLVKLTGDSDAATRGEVRSLLEDAERFLQQYRYREHDELTADGETDRRLYLWAVFDSRTLDEAVRRTGLSTWGRERPASLVWLAVEDDRGRQLIGMEQGGDYLLPLEQAARERALPLLLPLLDLEDTANLSPDDIWAGATETIRRASQRYSADVILSARVETAIADGDVYEVHWTAFMQDDVNTWTSRGETLHAAFREGIQPYGDRLAARFAPRTPVAQAGSLILIVTAVDSINDYARTEDYLNSLSNVTRVTLRSVAPGEVTFEIEAAGGDRALEQAISLGRTLRPESGGNGHRYRLLP